MKEIMSYGNTKRALFTMLKKILKTNRDEQDKYEKIQCRRMHLDNWKSPLHLQAGWHLCPRQQEDTGLAQGEPYGGVGEGGLSS